MKMADWKGQLLPIILRMPFPWAHFHSLRYQGGFRSQFRTVAMGNTFYFNFSWVRAWIGSGELSKQLKYQDEVMREKFHQPSFIECCVHYCGLQIFHVSASFQLLSLFVRIVWSQSSLWDRQPMFVLVSLFLFFRSVFLLWLSAEYHNVLMCSSLCGPHKTTFC